MAVLRWIRKLIGYPLLWTGRVLLSLKSPASAGVLKAAWAISGEDDWSRFALLAVRQYQGIDATIAAAEASLARRPAPEPAAIAGLAAFEASDLDAAESYLLRGRQVGNDRHGILDSLELLTATRRGLREGTAAAHRLLQRRDLPPHLSKMVQSIVCLETLRRGELDQADRQARRLLDIERNGEAEMVLCAVAKSRGDAVGAQAHRSAAGDLPAPRRLYLEALGDAAIGHLDQAREALEPLRAEAPELARDLESVLTDREAAP
jgi:hypothetical protein